jgi:hypothetical protein
MNKMCFLKVSDPCRKSPDELHFNILRLRYLGSQPGEDCRCHQNPRVDRSALYLVFHQYELLIQLIIGSQIQRPMLDIMLHGHACKTSETDRYAGTNPGI